MSEANIISQAAEAPQVPASSSDMLPVEKAPAPWLDYAIKFAIDLVVIAAALLAYHQFAVVPNMQRFAYLDIGELMEIKQLQVASTATAPGSTEADRERAFGDIAKFAAELERAISDLQSECKCTLLVRAAIVKSREQDMTPLLKERLGLAGIEREALLKSLGAAKNDRKNAMNEDHK